MSSLHIAGTRKKTKTQLAAWCLYEWGSHAFPIIVVSYVYSVYFTNYVADNKILGTYQWAYAITISSFLTAVSAPIFGSIADYYGRHKYWLLGFASIAIISCFCLWFVVPNTQHVHLILAIIVIGTLSFELSNVFFDTYLFYLAPPHYVGRLSGWARGLGYLGGIAVLSIALFVFVRGQPLWLNIQLAEHIRICGPLGGLWYAIFAMPFFILVPNIAAKKITIRGSIKKGFKRLGSIFTDARKDKNVFLFLLARMIYNDGLITLFSFGGIYLSGTLGMEIEYILMFGIISHLTAGVGAILLAWADDYFGSKKIILISLMVFLIGIFLLLTIHHVILFWIVSLFCSLFIGPVQAASRALMVRIVPPDKITEMFGLYAFSGKASSFLGPWLFGVATYVFNSQRAGMATISIFFVLGGLVLIRVKENR